MISSQDFGCYSHCDHGLFSVVYRCGWVDDSLLRLHTIGIVFEDLDLFLGLMACSCLS